MTDRPNPKPAQDDPAQAGDAQAAGEVGRAAEEAQAAETAQAAEMGEPRPPSDLQPENHPERPPSEAVPFERPSGPGAPPPGRPGWASGAVGFPTLLGGLVVTFAATFGLAALGGWGGLAASALVITAMIGLVVAWAE